MAAREQIRTAVPTATAATRLATAGCLLVLAGCGTTDEASDPATRAVPLGVPVQAHVSDLAFDKHGDLVALDSGKVGKVDARGRVTGKRVLRPFDNVVAGAALSPDATQAALYVQAGRSRARAVALPDGAVRWTADAGTSQYEESRGYWSADGTRLLLETDGPLRLRQARTGRLIRSFPHGTRYLGRQPLSPDGSTLAVTAKDGVALLDARTGRRRVIDLGAALDRPTWSADGRHIAGGGAGVVVVDVASGQSRRLRADAGDELAWSPDGRWLAAYAVERNDEGEAGVSLIDVRTGRSTVIAKTGAREEQGRLTWSPDSRRVAYMSPPGVPCAPEAGGGIC